MWPSFQEPKRHFLGRYIFRLDKVGLPSFESTEFEDPIIRVRDESASGYDAAFGVWRPQYRLLTERHYFFTVISEYAYEHVRVYSTEKERQRCDETIREALAALWFLRWIREVSA